jgi:hypothetical protein
MLQNSNNVVLCCGSPPLLKNALPTGFGEPFFGKMFFDDGHFFGDVLLGPE